MMKSALRFFLFLLPWIVFELLSPYGVLPPEWKVFIPERPVVELKVTITEISAKVGLDFQHKVISMPLPGLEHIQGWVVGSGASVAVSDVDLDGFPDVYFNNMDLGYPNRLFRNQRNGTFRDETARFFPFPTNTSHISFRPIFFDCDNDGDQDLLQLTSHCPQFYLNQEGQGFKDVTRSSGLNTCHAIYGNVVDFNNDGLLDVIYASYNLLPADAQMDHFFQSKNKNQFVAAYANQGSCRFSKVEKIGITDVGMTHVVGIADLRGIGRKDIWLVSDVGTDRVYFDNGDGTYDHQPEALKWSFSRHGMAFDVLYEENQKLPLVYVSHVFKPAYQVEGNALWKVEDPQKGFSNLARDYQIERCGHAWGAKFHDIDLDGDEDLIVSNGFLSQNPNKHYHFPMALLATTHRDYLKQAKNWPAIGDASIFGYDPACLFIRDGDTFKSPSAPNPLTEDLKDGRGVAVIDVGQNGRPSIVIVNHRQRASFFAVEPQGTPAWLGIKLQGRCSNRDALGTLVTLHTDQGPQKRWYYPTNGYSAQTENSLIFGLGHAQVQSIQVRWPNGYGESFRPSGLNRYLYLVEGEGCVAKTQ